MSDVIKQRLHPLAIVFMIFSTIKEIIFTLGIGFIFIFNVFDVTYSLIFIGLMFIFVCIISILKWLQYSYWIEADELKIEYGIFVKKNNYIPANRIHKIDLSASILHRIFKLVHVEIDTAGSDDKKEASLLAVKRDEGLRIRRQLRRKQTKRPLEDRTVSQRESVSLGRLFLAGSTSGSIGVILVTLMVTFSQFEEFIPEQIIKDVFYFLKEANLALIILISVVIAFMLWLIGIATTMIKYGNFQIDETEDGLHIRRGLLEIKQHTLSYDRIQAIGIEANPVRELLGYVRIYAVVAGASLEDRESYSVLHPLIKKSEVTAFLEAFIPTYCVMPTRKVSLPRSALIFYLFRSLIIPVILFVFAYVYFESALIIFLILLILSVLLAYFRYKDAYYAYDDQHFVFESRTLNKRQIHFLKTRLQCIEVKQNKLQKQAKLVTIKLSLLGTLGLGTHFYLKHYDEEEVLQLANWFRQKKTYEK